MNILIVGAGAVGLVYGQYFARAGHRVTFFIKENHRAALEGGVVLVEKRRWRADRVSPVEDFSLLWEWDEVASQTWDQVVLAISSDALRALPFDTVRPVTGDATVVMLQPSDADYVLLSEYWPAGHTVKGMINLISYYHPLPGEKPLDDPAAIKIAYFIPPTAMPLSGDSERVIQTLALFRDSGIGCKEVDDAVSASRLPNALLMTFLCALEASDWQFDRLRSDRALLSELVCAQKDLLTVLAHDEGPAQRRTMKLTKGMLSKTLYRMVLRVAPMALPFSLQVYLHEHFMKVRIQTDLYVRDYRDLCDSEALAALHKRVFQP